MPGAALPGSRGAGRRTTGGPHSLSRPLITVAGFPVTVHPSFLLTAALLAGARTFSLLVWWVLIVFVSVLAHELGHALAFRGFGIASEIQLYGLGGLTRPTAPGELTPWRRIAVSLAGPLTGVALGIAVIAVSRAAAPAPGSTADQLIADAIFVNIVWSIANLLPILPLDGGQVMASMVRLASRRHADAIAQLVSMVAAFGVAGWALAHGLGFTAVVVAALWGASAVAFWRQRAAGADAPRQGELQRGWASLRAGEIQAAEACARDLLSQSRSRPLKAEAARLLAMAGVVSGRPEVADEGLRRLPRGVQPDPYLEGMVAFASGRFDLAVQRLTDAFAAHPSDAIGRVLVRALVGAGHPEDAVSLVAGPQAEHVGAATNASLVLALDGLGRSREAAERGETALVRWPDADLATATALAWRAAGEEERSQRWLAAAGSYAAGSGAQSTGSGSRVAGEARPDPPVLADPGSDGRVAKEAGPEARVAEESGSDPHVDVEDDKRPDRHRENS